MTHCEYYDRHETGEMDDAAFERHAATCETCRQLLEADRQLLTAARELAPPERSVETLWPAIDAELEEAPRRSAWPWVARIAAVLVLLAGGAAYWTMSGDVGDGLLMDEKALAHVESAERAHVAAIETLQARVAARERPIDPQLRDLFELRLATIDAQIERCREAIGQNPGNASVRRFLLAALQEKETTLRRMMEEPRNGEGS